MSGKLHLRPFVTAVATCFGCGKQFENLGAEQEQRLREAQEQRRTQASALATANVVIKEKS